MQVGEDAFFVMRFIKNFKIIKTIIEFQKDICYLKLNKGNGERKEETTS